MKVRIDGIYKITGRGWILSVRDSRLSRREVPCDTTVTAGGREFTVVGVERSMYGEGWFSPLVGIRLRPNDQVEECFREGQEIEIKTKEL